jgi:hypothetical protein
MSYNEKSLLRSIGTSVAYIFMTRSLVLAVPKIYSDR